MELCPHSPPASHSKDHNVATGSCTSSFYYNFLVLQNGVFYGIVAGISLINCIELLQSFINNGMKRLSLDYLTSVSQFYNR